MQKLAPIPSVAELRGLSPREISTRVLAATPEEYKEVVGAQLDASSLHSHQLGLPRLLGELRVYRQTSEIHSFLNRDKVSPAQFGKQGIRGKRESSPRWQWAATTAIIVATVFGAAGYQNSLADRAQQDQTASITAKIVRQSDRIADIVHQEAIADRKSNSWRVPTKVHLQMLPAGTYQMMETNPTGERRWVTVELVVERPQWLPLPGSK
ncbi:hypothetical protein JIN84_08980 [Luteolibacter yonseiensis]|uniref:Uncharacterized protein n=1 Tax=Luteolibacter yonseiensis TaxID=1144680 RepID=A0A934R5X5_9BACT|nr:hypothetical protein [Luteolibacter yonseiensis]MBK1815749.1 hypothetical protein [Luteolibacter yonseiensis]